MTFKNSPYYNTLKFKEIHLEFGNYYFCDHFVIAEINEGIDFTWDNILNVAMLITEYYGNNVKVGYISNRVNSYSNDPRLWSVFEDNYNFIVANAIVSYNRFGGFNADLEKYLTKSIIKRCTSLKEAIEWMISLKEFSSIN